jgi:hypothetical protein
MRRRYTRYKTSDLTGRVPVAVRAEVADISVTGASLRTNHQLKIGRDYLFELGDKGATLKVKGNVRWSRFEGTREDGSGGAEVVYSTGVAFGEITTRKTQEMKRFIEHYADLSPGDRLFGQVFPDGRVDEDGGSFGIQVQKISRRKMLGVAEMAVEPGSLCELVLVLDTQRFESAAKVVSLHELSRSGRQASFSLGLEFIDTEPHFAAVLDAYFEEEMARRRPTEPVPPPAIELRGNPRTRVYHCEGCRHFRAKGSTVDFTSREQAEAAGYRPAKDCLHS